MSGFFSGSAAPWVVTLIVVPSGAALARAVQAIYKMHSTRVAALEAREAAAHERQLAQQEELHAAAMKAQSDAHNAQITDHRAHLAAQVTVYQGAVEREGQVRTALHSLATLPTVVAEGIETMHAIAAGEREHTAAMVRHAVREEGDRAIATIRDASDRAITAIHAATERTLAALHDRPSQSPKAPGRRP